jgi:hypothetical protein
MQCPLCSSNKITHFHRDKQREYLQCTTCFLVFVPPEYHLSAIEEKKEYDKHCNNVQDIGYRNFLNRLFIPMLDKIAPPPQLGLDFGCGPGPALAAMFEEANYKMECFDKFYFPDQTVLQKKYDFITATEVIEHLNNPYQELIRLWSLLNTDGTLGVMTKLVMNKERFASWHYIRDLTHISFFSKGTFNYLAQQLNAKVSFAENDVIFLWKK